MRDTLGTMRGILLGMALCLLPVSVSAEKVEPGLGEIQDDDLILMFENCKVAATRIGETDVQAIDGTPVLSVCRPAIRGKRLECATYSNGDEMKLMERMTLFRDSKSPQQKRGGIYSNDILYLVAIMLESGQGVAHGIWRLGGGGSGEAVLASRVCSGPALTGAVFLAKSKE